MFWLKRSPRCPAPRKPAFQPRLEELESRLAPATFTPQPSTVDGARLSLRDAINSADSNGDASNTILLAAGTYTLSDTLAGNLQIQDTAAGLSSKTLTIVGQGSANTITAGSS